MKKEKILVVDDEKPWRDKVAKILGAEYLLTLTSNSKEALNAIGRESYELVIIDLNLDGNRDGGIDLLIKIRKIAPGLRAIILTGFNDVSLAVASVHAGALDYITKGPVPILSGKLKDSINKHKRTKLIKAFLSYERSDIDTVTKLNKSLSVQGFLPWQDTEETMVGKFEPRIREEINGSDFFIACLSPNLISKVGFVQKEIRWALKKQEEFPEGKGYIIPVRLVDCKIPESINEYQAVDLFRKDGFIKLVKMLLSTK